MVNAEMSDYPDPQTHPEREAGGLRSRRDSLRSLAGLVGLAAATGLLSACGGRTRRTALDNTIGEPIPEDPVLHRTRPSAARPARTVEPKTPVVTQADPTAISRRQWAGAGPILARANAMGSIDRITIHHDGISTPPTGSWSDSVRRLESIRRGHVAEGWADIGYHFSIDPAGRVWQCRPLQLQGAHVHNQNEHNIGVMVMGNFERIRPTAAATASIAAFVAELMRRYNVSPSRVYTHQELAPTACPGRNLQAYMAAARGRTGVLASI